MRTGRTRRGCFAGFGGLERGEHPDQRLGPLLAQGFQLGLPGGMPQAVVPDAAKAFGQDVLQEPPEKFRSLQPQLPGPAALAIIFVGKGDVGLIGGQNPRWAQGHPLRVAAQVAQEFLRSGGGGLEVDLPRFVAGLLQTPPEVQSGRHHQPALAVESLEGPEKGRLKHLAQGHHGEEKVSRVPGRDPTSVGVHSAAGDQVVDVGMKDQLLAPGVEDPDEPDLRSQPLRITGKALERLGRVVEEQAVEEPAIPGKEQAQFGGDGEDGVIIADGQEAVLLGFQPLPAFVALALRAVPVAAGVVDTLPLTTVGTDMLVAAPRRGLAGHNRPHRLPLHRTQGMSLPIRRQEATHDRREHSGTSLHGPTLNPGPGRFNPLLPFSLGFYFYFTTATFPPSQRLTAALP